MKSGKIIMFLIAALFLSFAFSLRAESAPKKSISNFVRYEDMENKFSLQYPQEWTLINRKTPQSEIEATAKKIRISSAAIREDLGRFPLLLFRAGESGYSGSIHLVRRDPQPGVGNEQLRTKSLKDQYAKALLERHQKQAGTAAMLQNPKDSNFGGQYFMTAQLTFGEGRGKMGIYQALSIVKQGSYTINLNVPMAFYDAAAAEFEKMLGSIEFR